MLGWWHWLWVQACLAFHSRHHRQMRLSTGVPLMCCAFCGNSWFIEEEKK